MGSEEIYYEIARDKLEAQLASVDALDSKAATAFTFAAGVMTFFGALLAITSLGSDRVFVRPAGVALSQRTFLLATFLLAGGTFGRIIYLLQRAYRVHGEWSTGPVFADLERECAVHKDDKAYMQLWMARMCRASFEQNAPLVKEKADRLKGALNLILVEAVFVAVTGFVALVAK